MTLCDGADEVRHQIANSVRVRVRESLFKAMMCLVLTLRLDKDEFVSANDMSNVAYQQRREFSYAEFHEGKSATGS